MRSAIQLVISDALVKSADRQYVSPGMAAMSSLLPMGAAIHGTVAGHSPREGLREEVGQMLGNAAGGVAGGAVGALAAGGTAISRGMGKRELALARVEAMAPGELAKARDLANVAVAARGMRGALLGGLGGAYIGGKLLGAAGAGIAAHGGNQVVRENRIHDNPILSRLQDFINRRAGR